MADASQQMLGEFRSGLVAGTALVAGVTFARKGLLYAESRVLPCSKVTSF
jgi:hypothetical protein